MKIIITILSIMVLLVSCTSVNNYNKPFINAEDTTKLTFGMSIADVLTTLGDPFYVESGGNSKVVYVYEVRTILVQSNLSEMQPQPSKNSNKQKHDEPIHEMRLTFEDGLLISWGKNNEK